MDKNKFYYLLAVILILGSIAIFIVKDKKQPDEIDFTMDLPVLSQESQSKVPAGFLESLILGEGVVVLEGETSEKAPYLLSNQIEYTLTTSVKDGVSAINNKYLDLFKNAGWKVVSSTASPVFAMISATRGSYSVDAVFNAKAGNTEVLIRQVSPKLNNK
jgi:hypothetical protein